MPLPENVSKLKLNGDDPHVQYVTSVDVPDLVTFYREQAKRCHWEADDSHRSLDEDVTSMAYVIPGGKRIIVEMNRLKSGKTIVFQRLAKKEEGGE